MRAWAARMRCVDGSGDAPDVYGAKPESSWLDRQRYMDKLTAVCDRMDMRLMETGR